MFLHLEHRGRARGDSYSSLIDHAQPPLALLTAASLVLLGAPLVFDGSLRWLWLVPTLLLVLFPMLHLPMMVKLLRRTRAPGMIGFWWMSSARSLWRGVGLAGGMLAHLTSGGRMRRGVSLRADGARDA